MNKKSYSGPYLWLALAAVAMPIVLAVRAFTSIPQPYTYPEIQKDESGVDQRLWDHLIRHYAAAGRVDYDGFKRDRYFIEYIRQLAESDPSKLPDEDHKLAYYCNAYNALVIHGVIKHKIDASVNNWSAEDGTGFFDVKEHILAGKTVSLNYIEHDVIRPTFKEPRIHMALVCAAVSCPEIRGEAYFGDRVREQLEDQAAQFANNTKHVHYVPKEKKLYLSAILDWYGEDFGGRDGYLPFLLERADGDETKTGLNKAIAGEAEIAFNKYDWTLNTQSKVSGGPGPSDFGSGSVPNE